MPEPEKGLELNIALVKQLTGGDTFTGRFLNENPVEFCPECKFFINTNHLPQTSDDTVFASGRVKLIPFERHFKPEEQDTGLKKLFRRRDNMSGILNWLVSGYRLMLEVGLEAPPRIAEAIAAYRLETDIIGSFLDAYTTEEAGGRLPTSVLHAYYMTWAKDNGYRPKNSKDFIAELRRRGFDLRRNGKEGNVIREMALSWNPNPMPGAFVPAD
jgi:putative DNA primase/helicase